MITEDRLPVGNRIVHWIISLLMKASGMWELLSAFAYSVLLLICKVCFARLCKVGFVRGSILIKLKKKTLMVTYFFKSFALAWTVVRLGLLIRLINYPFNDLLLKLSAIAYLFCLLACTSFHSVLSAVLSASRFTEPFCLWNADIVYQDETPFFLLLASLHWWWSIERFHA